jgi:hypothetical protein
VVKNLTSYPYYDIMIALPNRQSFDEKDGNVSFSCIGNARSGREALLLTVLWIEGVVKAAATPFM